MTESDKAVMQQSLRFLIKALKVAQGHAPCELYADAIKVADSVLQQITIPHPEQTKPRWIELNDSDRRQVFESLPDRLDGFLKTWGWLHFAKDIEEKCREKNIAQPVQPTDIQKQLADLHQYEEIAEHYAKCAISPEALRDWVVTAQQPVIYAGVVKLDAATQTALDKAFANWEIKLCTDAIKQGNVTIRKPLK